MFNKAWIKTEGPSDVLTDFFSEWGLIQHFSYAKDEKISTKSEELELFQGRHGMRRSSVQIGDEYQSVVM